MEERATVRRIFVSKKPGCDTKAAGLLHDLKLNLGIKGLKGLRIYNRYDVSGLTDDAYALARTTVFAEPPVDHVMDETTDFGDAAVVIGVEALPGQYDQRADSAAQCLQILTQEARPLCKTACFYAFDGVLADADQERIEAWLINPVESRRALLEKPDTLAESLDQPGAIPVVTSFRTLQASEKQTFLATNGFAMTVADLDCIQDYFNAEGRDPTWTELRVLDTYWSDHCRHTTFLTQITSVDFPDANPMGPVYAADWQRYLKLRQEIYQDRIDDKPPCLMDLATLAMKELRRQGHLDDLDVSEEINACSIRVTIPVDDVPTEYLVMFKNETHNHPTEIEPFGGAATCIGGAIRDPLSGRSYVYQAMRVTGSGDPTRPVSETLPGKLSQRKITTTAAAGYSSYGNQIGLATGLVDECYHPGYVAKRMEIGAVIGAAPADFVRREKPQPGDRVVLIGGRTGRDGCGGATGSSKAHDESSIIQCGSEVQKGNAPTERKIQRLFRDPQVTRLIKRCNDFGAGGVSVAIGELADGLRIDLDQIPKKYEGLDGTELAISESQERMAVVVAQEDAAALIAAADRENIEATVVAEVTEEPRMTMLWRGQPIVNLKRAFIDTNGARQQASAVIDGPDFSDNWFTRTCQEQVADGSFAQALLTGLASLSGCSRRGLAEQFDSTIGAGTLLMPFGGCEQQTPEIGMAAHIPVPGNSQTDACSLMTYGFDPGLSEWSPYHGAVYAVLESLARIAALGGSADQARLTFQEYFRRLERPQDWGLPLSALLGAFQAQIACQIPAIGGKDSMSGTFRDLHVPPTLVSFAVQVSQSDRVLSGAIDRADRAIYCLPVPLQTDLPERCLPDYQRFMEQLKAIDRLCGQHRLIAASVVRRNGAAVAVAQMCLGNRLGCAFEAETLESLFKPQPGALLIVPDSEQTARTLEEIGAYPVGKTLASGAFEFSQPQQQKARVSHDQALQAYEQTLSSVFPLRSDLDSIAPFAAEQTNKRSQKPEAPSISRSVKPRVLIPVFPGTNCEYDSARAFARAGGEPVVLVVRNNTPAAIRETIDALKQAIDQAQIVMLPGGFSAGDEPEGSGKFIAAMFRNPSLTEAVHNLLDQRDGLMLGICNGFQALIKLGLLPLGRISPLTTESPTLTFNRIGRHASRIVTTRIVSNQSPWLRLNQPGDQHQIPISHGEGRFIAPTAVIGQMARNGQIATQYVGFDGAPSALTDFNPNGSMSAIEGITSADGRIFGKMGHSERIGPHLLKNVPGEKDQHLFEAGVTWFTG